MSITDNSRDESEHGKQIEYWQFYRTRLKQGMLFRGIGNLTLNNVRLWWITLACADKSLNSSEKYEIIRQKADNLLKVWRKAHNICHYVIILSGGDNGDNPHYHIVSTASLPDRWQSDGLDLHCELIGNALTDAKKLARYAEANLRQELPFKAKSMRKSAQFKAWSNPLIYHLYRDNHTPVSVYVHNSRLLHFNQEAIPPLKTCRLCHHELPDTVNYFNRRGSANLRSECYRCQSVKRRLRDMYKRCLSSGYNVTGKLPYADVLQLVHDSMTGHQYRCYWTGELIDSYELDHIRPLSRGGYHAVGNLCVPSARINRIKADMTLKAWLRWLWVNGYNHHLIPSSVRDMPRQQTMFRVSA